MSLLDPNFDIAITEKFLYELVIKQFLKNSSIKDIPINKIYYHNRIKNDNRYKYVMYYNRETMNIQFFNIMKNNISGDTRMWFPVCYLDNECQLYHMIDLEMVFEQIKKL